MQRADQASFKITLLRGSGGLKRATDGGASSGENACHVGRSLVCMVMCVLDAERQRRCGDPEAEPMHCTPPTALPRSLPCGGESAQGDRLRADKPSLGEHCGLPMRTDSRSGENPGGRMGAWIPTATRSNVRAISEEPARGNRDVTMGPFIAPETERLVDVLTGLANRVALETYLAGRDAEPQNGPIGLIAIEMSRFGSVTDSVGAELGNRIISMVAKRLQKMFLHAAVIARTHGDHFCLVFEGDFDLDEQVALLQDFTQRPLALKGEVIVLSVRLGIAVQGHLIGPAARLLHAAEVALHRAKRDRVKRCFYRSDFESDAKAAHQLENDLRVSMVTKHMELHRAISNEEFRVLYQPIVDAARGQVHALEALIRWHHPQRGIISPADFIPMAEQIQVMDVLGNWIMRRACADAMSFPANADGTLPGVTINVSPSQFIETGILLETVRQSLRESGIEPARVKLEITESMAMRRHRKLPVHGMSNRAG